MDADTTGMESTSFRSGKWIWVILACGFITPLIGYGARAYWVSFVERPDLGPFLWWIDFQLITPSLLLGFLVLAFLVWCFPQSRLFRGPGRNHRTAGILAALCIFAVWGGWGAAVKIPEDEMFSLGDLGIRLIFLWLLIIFARNLAVMAVGLLIGQLAYETTMRRKWE